MREIRQSNWIVVCGKSDNLTGLLYAGNQSNSWKTAGDYLIQTIQRRILGLIKHL